MRNAKTSFTHLTTHLTTTTSLLKNLVVLVMAWSLAVAPEMVLAQGKPPQKPTANVTASARAQSQQEEPGEQTDPRRGPQDGIKVHGHWVIEVHNPDGSLVSHTEFENSLTHGYSRATKPWHLCWAGLVRSDCGG